MTKPTLGALVLYTTASGAALPAVVVHVHPSGMANLQVFTDESLPNILHIGEVEQREAPETGTFHFAADATSEKSARKSKAEKGAE